MVDEVQHLVDVAPQVVATPLGQRLARGEAAEASRKPKSPCKNGDIEETFEALQLRVEQVPLHEAAEAENQSLLDAS